MLSFIRAQVPAYLHASSFYQSLNEDDDAEITIAERNMKANTIVESADDLKHMLLTSHFWGLETLPETASHFAMFIADEDALYQLGTVEEISQDVQCLKAIRLAEGEKKIYRAIEFGRLDFVRYLLNTGVVLSFNSGVYAAVHNQLACLQFIAGKLVETMTTPYETVSLHSLPNATTYACWAHLQSHGAYLRTQYTADAARLGSVACLQFLHEHVSAVNSRDLEVAVKNGHLSCVAFIHEVGAVPLRAKCAAFAAYHGHIPCLEYLIAHDCPIDADICEHAAEGCHLECLQYLHQQGYRMNLETMSLDCIQYMRESGVRWNHRVYRYALADSRFDLLEYYHDQGLLCSGRFDHSAACQWNGESLRFIYERGAVVQKDSVQTMLSRPNGLVCLQVALEFGYQPTAEDAATAAEHGAMESLQLLHESGCPWDERTTARAVTAQQLHALKYAVENGCPISAESCAKAYMLVRRSSVCLQFLHRAGVLWDTGPAIAEAERVIERTLAKLKSNYVDGKWGAAEFANEVRYCPSVARMAVVQYLHSSGCPWNAKLCTLAAGMGYLDVLQYAHEHGCAWNYETANAAASFDAQNYDTKFYSVECLQCLQYLHEQGCEAMFAIDTAARCGAFAALKYLHQQGYQCHTGTCAAAAGHHSLRCLQYLHEQGVPWDARTCSAAAANLDVGNLQYAHEHGCPWDETTCTSAARAGSLVCLRYAHENGCDWSANAIHAARGAVNCIEYLLFHDCPTTLAYYPAPQAAAKDCDCHTMRGVTDFPDSPPWQCKGPIVRFQPPAPLQGLRTRSQRRRSAILLAQAPSSHK